MSGRRIGYAVWLLLAACLYFFENGTGTRIVLLASLLVPLLPPLRPAFFSADQPGETHAAAPLTIRTFVRPEADEPGDVRPYMPGDPVRRIHWKLSAKKDELLIREPAPNAEPAEEERTADSRTDGARKRIRKKPALFAAAGLLLCIFLLLLLPKANRSAQALCNRVFAASETSNAYAYRYFPTADDQSILPASALLAAGLALWAALMVLLRSRLAALGLMALFTLFQAYFGLPFPAWVNVPLYALLGLWMMKRPFRPRFLLLAAAGVLIVSLLTAVLLPGADAATEAASETVRDRLNRIALQLAGALQEAPAGETETRHVHDAALETGEGKAQTGREYRLVTAEEEQISMPQWISWLRIALLFLLMIALLTLPFAPFLLLNARKKKAQEIRKAFASEDVNEAVCAVFRQVITWLEATGNGAGNRLYRDWTFDRPDALPDGYAGRFAGCAAAVEEAVYGSRPLPEEARSSALALLKETEEALWKKADWKQRLRLRYWLCLCE